MAKQHCGKCGAGLVKGRARCKKCAKISLNRKNHFKRLMEIVIKHKEDQWAAREFTWGSLEVDATSIGETIAACVVGTRGHGQRGQAKGNKGRKRPDFVNGMECKSGDRAYPNHDYLLHGVVYNLTEKKQYIRIADDLVNQNTMDQLGEAMQGIHRSLQGAKASIQQIQNFDGDWYGLPNIGLTQSGMFVNIDASGEIRSWHKESECYVIRQPAAFYPTDYLEQFCRDNQGSNRLGEILANKETMINHLESMNVPFRLPEGRYICMSKLKLECENGEGIAFVLRQDDGHWNLGATSRKQMREMLSSGVAMVHHHHDMRGRLATAVFLLRSTDGSLGDVIDCWNDEDTHKPQINIRLFKDFERKSLYSGQGDKKVWGLKDIGGELLAYGVQTPSGFEVKFWNPNGGETSRLDQPSIERLFTEIPELEESCPIHPNPWSLPPDVSDDPYSYRPEISAHREWLAERYFRRCIVNFYRKVRPFTDYYNTPRNTGFSHHGETMDLIWFGLRGSRTNARGVDVYENDGTHSEVKTATGIHGDNMETRPGNMKFSFKDNVSRLQTTRRIFINRIIDFRSDGENVGGLRLAILTTNTSSMHQFHDGIVQFFSNTDAIRTRQGAEHATGREDLQYTLEQFDQNSLSPENPKRIDLIRVVEFHENPPQDQGTIQRILDELPALPEHPCSCEHCQRGQFRWTPDKEAYHGSTQEWKGIRRFEITDVTQSE